MEEKKEECKKCNKNLSKSQWWLIGISFYMLFTSIYGTVILIKSILNLF